MDCMDENNKDLHKPLLEASSTAINHDPSDTSSSQPASTNINAGTSSTRNPNFFSAIFEDIERGENEEQVFHNALRSIAPTLPQPNDFYTGTLYPANTTTNLQFWVAHNIPPEELYRSGVQLDEYVRNRQAAAQRRQQQEMNRKCCGCLGQTCCCMLGLGAAAGCITCLVYTVRFINSCDSAFYNPECYYDYDESPPSYSQSQSYSQNYTLVAEVAKALVNKTTKME